MKLLINHLSELKEKAKTASEEEKKVLREQYKWTLRSIKSLKNTTKKKTNDSLERDIRETLL